MVSGDGWALETVATPGHTANHVAFAVKDRGQMFIGDHVMGWSTSIVAGTPAGYCFNHVFSIDALPRSAQILTER